MDPTIVAEFLSKRAFTLYDCYIGHQHLLLRSEAGLRTGENVDLIFAAIQYLEIPFLLYGVRITRPRDEQAISLEKKFAAKTYDGDFVYAIESQGKRFHVIASTLLIHVNTLPIGISSLTPMCKGELDDQKAYYAQYVKEWYKIA